MLSDFLASKGLKPFSFVVSFHGFCLYLVLNKPVLFAESAIKPSPPHITVPISINSFSLLWVNCLEKLHRIK